MLPNEIYLSSCSMPAPEHLNVPWDKNTVLLTHLPHFTVKFHKGQCSITSSPSIPFWTCQALIPTIPPKLFLSRSLISSTVPNAMIIDSTHLSTYSFLKPLLWFLEQLSLLRKMTLFLSLCLLCWLFLISLISIWALELIPRPLPHIYLLPWLYYPLSLIKFPSLCLWLPNLSL